MGAAAAPPDDFITSTAGHRICGCGSVFDHAAKANQPRYPWAQNVVAAGLLQRIQGRWACLPTVELTNMRVKPAGNMILRLTRSVTAPAKALNSAKGNMRSMVIEAT